MRHEVLIRKNDIGESRWFDAGDSYDNELWQWTEGNYSCDCNRALFWARAGNEDDIDIDCSDGRFTAVVVVFEDGGHLNLDYDSNPWRAP